LLNSNDAYCRYRAIYSYCVEVEFVQCDKDDYDTVGKIVSLLVYFLQEKMND
jgi:hypothetical protein